MKKQLLVLFPIFLNTILNAQTFSENITTGTSWTAKCGMSTVNVKLWGAGGGGGKSSNSGQSTGGAGGGAFASKAITVSAGDIIPYSIGQGGAGGDNNKNGGLTWFSAASIVSAEGGKGVSTSTLLGGSGGLASNSIGDFTYSGGNGGNGTGDGAIHASGGGGGAARANSNGNNGANGVTGNIFSGGTGGAGGSSTSPGGFGGDGAGSNGEGDDGKSNGGGGGGAKRGALVLFDKDGGKGANGIVILSGPLAPGTPQPIQSIQTISSNPGTSIGCNESQVTLQANGGYVGNGVSTLWYEGNSCPSFKYINEFMGTQVTSNTSATGLKNGNRRFVASTGDPSVNMTNVLSGTLDVAKYKYITIRYRLISIPSAGNNFEIYFSKNGGSDLDETKVVRKLMAVDNDWHIININMSSNAIWNSGGNITGWRFDYATVSGTTIDIDYLLLGDTLILENNNDDDTTITLTPLDLTTTYGSLRVSDQEATCNATGIPTTTCTQTVISRIDKTYSPTTGNWSTAANWLPGNQVPNLNNCVRIQSGKNIVVDVNNAQAGRLTVDNGGIVTVPAGKALYVQNSIINNGNGSNFTVQSDGNLIQLSNAINTGKITVERSVSNMDNISTKMDYVYWSSPVTGQLFKGVNGFSDGTPANRIYQYNESNDFFVATPHTTFSPAKGYAIQAETSGVSSPLYNKTYNFVGVPNNGDFPATIKRSVNTGATVHGYNLIGNPYPSNINFDVLYEANKTLIYNQAWFWTNTSFTATQQGQGYVGNNYRVYNATGGQIPAVNGIIKVGQGFIIQSKGLEGSTSNFNFKNNYLGTPMRVADTGSFYQKSSTSKNRFWLKLISTNMEENTQLIGYVDGATNGFEMDYDAEAFGLSSNLFYSLLEDKRLVIQGKSAQFTNEDQVNLGANFFKTGSYTIEIEQPEGIFESSQNVYLKDKLNGMITNLSQGSYTFEAAKGETNGRFEIIYQPQTVLVTNSVVKDEVVVYRDSDNFVVQAPKIIATVEVYDLSGKLITIAKANNRQAVLNASFFNKGMYVLRIKTIDGEITNKKIMK